MTRLSLRAGPNASLVWSPYTSKTVVGFKTRHYQFAISSTWVRLLTLRAHGASAQIVFNDIWAGGRRLPLLPLLVGLNQGKPGETYHCSKRDPSPAFLEVHRFLFGGNLHWPLTSHIPVYREHGINSEFILCCLCLFYFELYAGSWFLGPDRCIHLEIK